MQEVVGRVHGHEVGRRFLADASFLVSPTLCYRLFLAAAVWLATLRACGSLPRLVSFFNMPASTATGRCCSPA